MMANVKNNKVINYQDRKEILLHVNVGNYLNYLVCHFFPLKTIVNFIVAF